MAARPKASEARNTRADLLEAALELFAEQGFYATSLREIGRAVGIRESAIYHHFASKEALLEAVLFDLDGEPPVRPGPLQAGEAAVQSAGDVAPLLERWVVAMMDKFSTLRERKRFRIMLTEGMRLAQSGKLNYFEKMEAVRQPVIDQIRAMMAAGALAPRDPEATAVTLIAPIMMWRQLIEVSPEHRFVQHHRAFAKQVVEQFLQGALPRSGQPAATLPPRVEPPRVEPPQGAVRRDASWID